MQNNSTITACPVFGLVARSGTGKTTLVRKLLSRLCHLGLRVGVIKHTHHDFEIDQPGKDSYEIRAAGARQVLLASPQRQALILEQTPAEELELDALLAMLHKENLDLVLVEGFHRAATIAKIEIHRHALGHPLLCRTDDSIIAVATDSDPVLPCGVEKLPLNDAAMITEYILKYCLFGRSPGDPHEQR